MKKTVAGQADSAFPHMVPRSPKLPLGGLDHHVFEELVVSIMREGMAAGCLAGDEVVHLPEGPDGGRDIVVYLNSMIVTVVQCKRVAVALNEGQVFSELIGFCLHKDNAGPQVPYAPKVQYQLWTARQITAGALAFMAAPQATTDADLLPMIRRARRKSTTLSKIYEAMDDDEKLAADERVQKEIRAVQLAYVGPARISELLDNYVNTRRRYFAGPDDVNALASIQEIDRMVSDLTERRLISFERRGMGVNDPYVPEMGLENEYREFQSGPKHFFVLVGGSGRGKSTWVSSILRQISSTRTWVIDATDIEPGDSHAVDTLARLLQTMKIDHRLVTSLRQGLLRWFEQPGHLIIVDALDRVRSTARETVGRWLSNSLEMMEMRGHRCVITSRPEAWRQISPILRHLKDRFHQAGSALTERSVPAFHLAALTADQAGMVYAAYGLPRPGYRQRYLRTPSLIRTLSTLPRTGSGHPVSRMRVLQAFVDDVASDASNRVPMGRFEFGRLQQRLGVALRNGGDGWIDGSEAEELGVSDNAIDRLATIEFLQIEHTRFRPASDDLIEYLVGREFGLEDALRDVDQTTLDDLRVGSLGIAAAFSEERDPSGTGILLKTFYDRSRPIDPAGASARIIVGCLVELESHECHHDVILALFSDWNRKNFLLMAYPLGELIRTLRLPSSTRLSLLMTLARTEEEPDWREKFWFDATAMGRHVTILAEAATAAIEEDPVGALAVLEASLGGADQEAKVARGLVFEAFGFAPQQVLSYFWTNEKHQNLVDSLFQLKPIEAAKFLQQAQFPTASRAGNAAVRLWEILTRELDRAALSADELRAFSQAAGRAAELTEWPKAKMCGMLCDFVADASGERLELILGSIDLLSPSDVWRLANAAPERLSDLLDFVFLQLDRSAIARASLSAVYSLDADEATIDAVATRMLASWRSTTHQDVRSAIAEGVEMLLRKVRPAMRALAAWTLAEEVVRTGRPSEKRPILFVVGSKASERVLSNDWLRARRDQLFDLMIATADADNLELLVRKLIESSPDRQTAAGQLIELVRRFGASNLAEYISMGVMGAMGNGGISDSLRSTIAGIAVSH